LTLASKAAEGMVPLTKEETALFERRLAMARHQLQEVDQEIERELREVRERIATLQEKRKASLKVYDAACTMLGIENDLAQREDRGEAG
jgi:flagellar motility protein MotE (MotC chaperone)